MSTDDERDRRVEQRLRVALQAEIDRHPLPDGFALSISTGLPDRRTLRRRSAFALPAFVTVAVAVIGFAAVLGSLSGVPGPGTSSIPSVTPESESPSVADVTKLTHFSNDVFSLDYPASWRVIAEDRSARHYEWIPLVVGIGDWMIPCETIAPTQGSLGGFHCGPDDYTVPPGGIVVTLTSWLGPAPIGPTAPPSAIQLASGIFATVADTPTASVWVLYIPSRPQPLTVEAHFDELGAEDSRAQVARMVESLRFTPLPSGS
jgi:hypothetical protein